MSETSYRITRRSGIDTAHRNPGEECNLDDSEQDQPVGEDEALVAVQSGTARPCGHCWAEDA